MGNSEFKHLNKEQLKKRVKILSVVAYLAGAIAIASFATFFLSDYKLNWSWLLIGVTYTLLPYSFVMQKRRMQKEITFREKRLNESKLP